MVSKGRVAAFEAVRWAMMHPAAWSKRFFLAIVWLMGSLLCILLHPAAEAFVLLLCLITQPTYLFVVSG